MKHDTHRRTVVARPERLSRPLLLQELRRIGITGLPPY
ncbi:uncharacterized protein METZ01_LOCUS304511 [marine metagenome]|uniref:Uncharacterized protein n=1 Tax=marine metagenome TaxID=408172 RepID=A0A382MV52_9ZZZZ